MIVFPLVNVVGISLIISYVLWSLSLLFGNEFPVAPFFCAISCF